MSSLRRFLGSTGLAALLAAALPAPVAAQSVGSLTQGLPSRQQLNPAARAAPQTPDRDLFSMGSAGPCPLTNSPLTFTLKSVDFHGAPPAEQKMLEGAYAGRIGQTIPVGEICDIRDTASRILFHNGILARVEIPEQRIADGALVMEVIEARVVNVQVRGDAGPVQDLVDSYVGKLRNMTPFDLNKAQRYLLLASDLPGVRVSAVIRPSTTSTTSTTSTERGAVDIDVTVKRDIADVAVNVQNMGSDAIGPWGGLVRGDLNSLTPFGEQTSLTLFTAFDWPEQRVAQLVETAHFGGEGLAGKLSLVYGETRPGGALAPLDLDSKAFVAEATLAYPLVRTRRRNLTLSGGLDWVDESTDLRGLGRLSADHLRVFFVRADADWRPMIGYRFLQLTGSAELRQGLPGIGASRDSDRFLSRIDAHPDAFVARVNGSVDVALAGPVMLHGALQAQYSPQALLAYEQLPLGVLTIGRGYDPSVLSGDEGVAGTIELRFGPFTPRPALQVQPYVFYDIGWVKNYGASQPDGSIDSVGVGLRARLTQRFSMDLAYACPLERAFAGQRRPDSKVLVNLTARF
jgi:hemolysin activation/secretion protein